MVRRSYTLFRFSTMPRNKVKATEYNLFVVGARGVGRSALTTQVVYDHFPEECDRSIEDSYHKLMVIGSETCLLNVLDMTDREKHMEIGMWNRYVRVCQGFLLVFAVNDPKSFEDIERYREDIRRLKDSDHIPMVFVGNKCDLTSRQVETATVSQVAQTYGIPFIETSAKTRAGVDDAVQILVHKIRRDLVRQE